MPWLFNLLVLCLSTTVYAQSHNNLDSFELNFRAHLPLDVEMFLAKHTTTDTLPQRDSLNYTDSAGLKQGVWFFYRLEVRKVEKRDSNVQSTLIHVESNHHLMTSIMNIYLDPLAPYTHKEVAPQNYFESLYAVRNTVDTVYIEENLVGHCVYGMYQDNRPVGTWHKVNLDNHLKGSITYENFTDDSFSVYEEYPRYGPPNDSLKLYYSADTTRVRVPIQFYNPIHQNTDSLTIYCHYRNCEIRYQNEVKEKFDFSLLRVKMDELIYSSGKQIIYHYAIGTH